MAALWQTYAVVYDGLLDLFTYQDMIAMVADAADCRDRVVLDVGAGTGNVTKALVDAGAAQVTAIDFSPGMLRQAHGKLRSEVRRGAVQLIRGEVTTTMAELPDHSIDRITAVNLLYALRRREEFFEQASRLLTDEGFLVVAHTTRPGAGPIARDQYRRGGIRALLHPRLIGIATIDMVIDLLARGGRYDFAPVDVLAREAAAAGLKHTTSLGRCYGDGDGVNELLTISAAPPSVTDLRHADRPHALTGRPTPPG